MLMKREVCTAILSFGAVRCHPELVEGGLLASVVACDVVLSLAKGDILAA